VFIIVVVVVVVVDFIIDPVWKLLDTPTYVTVTTFSEILNLKDRTDGFQIKRVFSISGSVGIIFSRV
jgi:hypothetical protein